MIPATSGDDKLVPPMRYSEYSTAPLGKVCVSPIKYPVLGWPTAHMSGTARPVRPCAWKTELGTTPSWHDSPATLRLRPPPEPYNHEPGVAGDRVVPVHE